MRSTETQCFISGCGGTNTCEKNTSDPVTPHHLSGYARAKCCMDKQKKANEQREAEPDPHQHLAARCGRSRARGGVVACRPRRRRRQPQRVNGQRGRDGEAPGIGERAGWDEEEGGLREALTRACDAVERRRGGRGGRRHREGRAGVCGLRMASESESSEEGARGIRWGRQRRFMVFFFIFQKKTYIYYGFR